MAEKSGTAGKSRRLGSCERCGRAIILSKFTLCYECRHQEKLEVDRALDYMKAHPGATLAQVSAASGVASSLLLKLIRGGRVEVQGAAKAASKAPPKAEARPGPKPRPKG